MLKMKNILKKYNDFSIDFSLEIKKGEIFAFIGESGSGKTTILKIIQGLIKQDFGDVILDENYKISSVFQDFNLLNNINVLDNVFLPLKLKGFKDKNKAKLALEFVSLLDKQNLYINSLSGGQKQRVAIARCIVENPNVLLLDEPTASLDNNTKNDMMDLFLKINEKYKTTIILVTHDLKLAKTICDRGALIENGKIKEIIKINKNSNDKIEKTYIKFAKEVLK